MKLVSVMPPFVKVLVYTKEELLKIKKDVLGASSQFQDRKRHCVNDVSIVRVVSGVKKRDNSHYFYQRIRKLRYRKLEYF